MTMNRPIAVLISDIHYNLANLELADKSMRIAIDKANSLGVPLIVAGDLHDTKANLRGECINAMIATFSKLRMRATIIIGNHDKINEKSDLTEHSLKFLAEYVNFIVDYPRAFDVELDDDETYHIGYLIPYYHDIAALRNYLRMLPKGARVIMHQGIEGANLGDYVHDKSAINPEDVAGLRIISGHYHARQTIKLPNGGSWDYIGSPYTQSYGEANDPEKGFQVLYNDGSLEFIPTHLREHVVLDYTVEELRGEAIFLGEEHDLVWVKIRGTKEELAKITKQQVAIDLDISQGFRLDLIPTDTTTQAPKKQQSSSELMDTLIDSLTAVSDSCKIRLKDKWKALI